jgi:hypothetical protein
VSAIHLLVDGGEIAARRRLLARGQVVEAWADHHEGGLVWVGDESKALLDAVGTPVVPRLSVPAESVPVFYGPHVCDIESLPREESLRARVLSAHGIAVLWITLDRFGQRVASVPSSPDDPVFHLRRIGGGAGHVWRLFQTRPEAVTYAAETYGRDSEASEWAAGLPVEDFRTLLRARAVRGAR